MATPGQSVFAQYILSNLASVIYWRVLTSVSQKQVGTDNVRESVRRVTHDYTIVSQFYVEMTGIYHNLIIRNKDHIDLLDSLQTLQFKSNR